MNPMDEQEARDQREAQERALAKQAESTHRKDVQEMMATAGSRRVLTAFLQIAAVDVSPLRHDNLTTGHAIGWQDGGSWWLNQLRAHCPEREAQMRNEAREAARVAPQEPTDD